MKNGGGGQSGHRGMGQIGQFEPTCLASKDTLINESTQETGN